MSLPNLANLGVEEKHPTLGEVCNVRTQQCSVCVGTEQCKRCAVSWWDAIPAPIKEPICASLIEYGLLKRCDPSQCHICAVHIKYAMRTMLQAPGQAVLKTLLEESLCMYANLSPSECEEWLTGTQGLRERWAVED